MGIPVSSLFISVMVVAYRVGCVRITGVLLATMFDDTFVSLKYDRQVVSFGFSNVKPSRLSKVSTKEIAFASNLTI